MDEQMDVMILGAGHSIMLSSLPKGVSSKQINEDFFKFAKLENTQESFGLFGSVNYNTYYNDVAPEDLVPQEGEFIEPVYRMLSECIVAKKYNPTDFSKPGVLKNSMPLLLGQSVYCDHDTEIGNALGAVKEVMWQDSFKQDGVVVPAGINAVLKIDGKSNPRIARGIMMDPPSIHSNSVTVTFKWEPSHNFDNKYEFYEKLGTYDEKGEMVRRIVTEIVSYAETSLVSHGADPFAQKITDKGKLNHIAYASKQYYDAMSNSDKPTDVSVNRVFFGDFKQVDKFGDQISTMHNTGAFIIKGGLNTDTQENQDKNSNTNQMNEEMIQFLESLFGEGLLSLAEGVKPSTELAIQALKEVIASKNALSEEKISLEAKVQLYNDYVNTYRSETVELYQKLHGDKADEAIISLLSNEKTGMETLKALRDTYQVSLNDKFPMQCGKCGSHEVSRGSVIPTEDSEGTASNSEDNKETFDSLETLANKKLK